MKSHELTLADLDRYEFSVVRIIARLNIGGPAQHVVHLTRELADTHATLLVTGEPEPDEAEWPDFGPGVHLCRVRELGRRIRFAQDLIAFVKIYRILRKVRPDIVHTHTAKAGAIGRIAAVLARVPIRIHTFHGHVFEGYFQRPMAQAVVWAERMLARFSSCIVAISQTQARDLTQRFGVCSESKVKIIPLGLNLKPFRHPSGSGSAFRAEIDADGAFLVVTVGRLAPIKNHALLVEAAALLKDTNTIFAFVGGGAEQPALQAQAAKLGVADRVRFIGWKHDLRDVYAAADVVVLTSLNEGTPVCLIEAMAAGVPVIASDVGGVRDLLDGGTYGTLFPSRDKHALAKAIRAAATATRVNHSDASDYVMERYSVERLALDVRRLYHELCERNGLRRAQEIPQPSYQT